ncbi:MAG TPA: sigma-54-dependent Fis family transcriptional regulator, partial [Candidatus Acidoferrales bacterium]|nr:sigma-54-dependent Fis family transcriptional regulator [Candidatus Acidoferrales bacterium]
QINEGLHQLVEHLGVDRGSISTIDVADGQLRTSHSWSNAAVSSIPIGLGESELPWAATQIRAGIAIVFSQPQELPPQAATDLATVQRIGVQSAALLPLSAGGRLLGTVHFSTVSRVVAWPDWILQRLRLIGEIFASVLLRRASELDLRNALAQVQTLTARLEAENAYLKEDAAETGLLGEIVGNSKALQTVLTRVAQVAPTEATVLILGETGAGKELIAKAIHEKSKRREAAFVKVNCAALPASLIESELFGHEKGAFTGAAVRKLGRFELADGGSIFLDEIGELPLDLQAKLLRVLQDGSVERLGSQVTQQVNVRIIAATNRDLKAASSAAAFRPDLYYRLAVFPITVPALRERREDIPALVSYFVRQLSGRLGKHVGSVPARVMDRLVAYDWPGNIRELRNVIERALILSTGAELQLDESLDTAHAPQSPSTSPPSRAQGTLEDVERAYILETLEACSWQIRGANQAAERLGLHPSTLYSRMKKLGINRRNEPGS